MLTELSVSLFSILLLPSLHNKVYTLFLYWSSLWQTNLIPSTVRPVSFAVATEIFDLLIVFNSVLLVSLFPSTILLLFSYSACSLFIVIQRSLVFKLTFFLPPKYYISFRKKKAVMLFQVWFRNHNGRFSSYIVYTYVTCNIIL